MIDVNDLSKLTPEDLAMMREIIDRFEKDALSFRYEDSAATADDMQVGEVVVHDDGAGDEGVEIKTREGNVIALKAPSVFTSRGDASAWDWSKGNFTKDGAYHTLDISSIVPTDAAAVVLFVQLEDNEINTWVGFQGGGYSNGYNVGFIRTIVADVKVYADLVIPCPGQEIQYAVRNARTPTTLDVLVKGWWK